MSPIPIKVGIIGLRAVPDQGYSAGTWGLQHFKALNASPHYTVTAVCNTSEESAAKAIALHKIPNAKAYGKPEDIAGDPNVDMVVVSVTCDLHIELMKPAIEAGKNVFIDFPVAPQAKQVKELAELAKEKGVDVVSGMQGRSVPAFRKVLELIQAGEIGDIVSSSLNGFIPLVTADGWMEAQKGFLELEPGISRIRGVFGHLLDVHALTVGDFTDIQPILKVQDKTAPLANAEGKIVDPGYPVTAPDTIFLNSVLANNAVCSINIRSARSAIDDVGFRWLISGSKAEIELTTAPGLFQAPQNVNIQLRRWREEAETIEFKEDETYVKDLNWEAVSLGRVWDAYAKGDKGGWPTLDDTFKVQQWTESIIANAAWAK